LSLLLKETPQGLHGAFEYNTDLFDAATIARMAAHFQILLRGIAADPEQRLSRLPLLTEAEQQELIAWNATEVEYPSEHCLHELFEMQVERTPEAMAVIFDEQRVTYAELNRRANQLAYYLRGLGVGPETLVGICVDRSVEMVVGLLGILKAGAAYVPLDPSYPSERLAFMLADAQIEVLLTQAWLLVAGGWSLATSPISQQPITICLDAEWDTITNNQQPATNNRPPATNYQPPTADSLAYLIYTSGSTGQPKGAMNTHRGIVNRLMWMQAAYQLTAADRVLQKTPFSFDVSVWEFFWPLLTGASLVMARPEGHKDSAYLSGLKTS
jgi:non-ribosomal peptide synthetase component F